MNQSSRGAELHTLLRNRWSPQTWDSTHTATESQIVSLLEAARWAPSAGNSQPWSFTVGARGDANHQRIVPHLAGSSKAWAPDASVLVVNICHRFIEGTDWDFSEFAEYDLGQAVAHMTIQAQAMGLSARQFRAFDLDSLTQELEIPMHWKILTITAFGVAQSPESDRWDPHDRTRRDDLLWNAQR